MSTEHFSELCTYDFTPLTTQLNVCLASKDNSDNYDYELLVMSETLKNEFLDIVKDKIKKLEKTHNNHNLELVDYDEHSRPEKHELECLDSSLYPVIVDQMKSLSERFPPQDFANDDAFISGLKFYAIVIDYDFYAFRLFNEKKELGRSKYFGVIAAKNHFDKFQDKMLLFDKEIDCILYKNSLFVFNRQHFKWIFNFLEKLREAALDSLNNIESKLSIANFEELRIIGESNQIVQMKLKSISSKDYLETLTIEKIKETILLFPELNLTIVENEGKECLHFDKKNKWNFLKLLDDGLLHSKMTDNRYSVSDKRKV